jgi:PEP-CTERM motif-containing protein
VVCSDTILSTAVTSSGSVTDFSYHGLVSLTDLQTSLGLYDYQFTDSSGNSYSDGIPPVVTLLAGRQYQIFAQSLAYSLVDARESSLAGSVSGSGHIQFTLTAVPEPSTLAIAALGAVACVAYARRSSRQLVSMPVPMSR